MIRISTIKSIVMSAAFICSASVSLSALASEELAKANNCLACHAVDTKLVGPSYNAIAEKYSGDESAAEMLATKVKEGGSGNWGQIPMPPNPTVSDEDVTALVDWILSLGG